VYLLLLAIGNKRLTASVLLLAMKEMDGWRRIRCCCQCC